VEYVSVRFEGSEEVKCLDGTYKRTADIKIITEGTQ
jgi:hypothetical protein